MAELAPVRVVVVATVGEQLPGPGTAHGIYPTQVAERVTALIKTRLGRMQYRPGLLVGFLAKTGLDLTPLSPRS